LQEMSRLARNGVTASPDLVAAGEAALAREPLVRIDYCKIVSPDTLEDVTDISSGTLAAVAAFVGTTRLIDNLLL
jgi:pantothenate synthetase